MRLAQALIALIAVVAVISAFARRVRIPYPILLVVGGLALGFVPWLPRTPLDPELILLFFLPPLLYADAFQTSWIEFRRWLRAILMLSVGLVAATVICVALVARHFFPELSWPAALALGAIVSPTDTVAAQSVIERLRIPRRMTAILGGESLVNDATGLVAFHFAIAVAVGASLQPWQLAGTFGYVAVGGIAIGLAMGWIASWLNRRIVDPGTAFAFSLLTPYVAYIVSWNIEVSAVLAVVTAGFYVSWRIHEIDATNRHQLYAVWTALTFLVSGFCFVLLGLEVRHLEQGLAGYDLRALALGGAAVCATVVVVRFLWVWPGTYVPRLLFPSIRKREPHPPASAVFIVGWCGMRGVVSLAAALAVPRELESGAAFPGRDVILFCTFCTILGTLLVQGLTLEPLIRWFGIGSDELSEAEERKARVALVNAALERLEQLAQGTICEVEEVRLTEAAYRARLRALEGQEELLACIRESDEQGLARNVQLQVLSAQKAKLLQLRDEHVINDATQLRLQMDLDLDEMRLMR